MRARTAVMAATAAVLAGGGTAYGDGSPVAGVAEGGPGVTWGALRYVALPTHDGTAVAQIDRATGEVNGYVALRGGWGFPRSRLTAPRPGSAPAARRSSWVRTGRRSPGDAAGSPS